MNDIIIPQGCIEGPLDERNWQQDEMFWGSKEVPIRASIDDNEFQDQSIDYPYGCVFFANSMGSNAMNFVEGGNDRSTWKWLCDYAEGINKFNPKVGAYIIDWPKVGVKLGYLSGYVEVKTVAQIKQSIASWRIVHMGSSQIDWALTIKNGYTIVWGNSYGHSMHIVGYDDNTELFKIKDSYGTGQRLGGYMYLKYENINLLFSSKYSLIDKEDEVISYKKRIMENITIPSAREAFTNGFWNGLNPQQPASREEVAAICQRLFEKLSKPV